MPTLLVAAAGGHLEELWQLRARLHLVDDDVTWVTFDTPQSRSLLAGEQRLFAPPARPRDAAATVANLRFARHVLALDDWTDLVSTGALMAVPFLTLARAQGIGCHFIESPARVLGPSLSGRILERVPGVRCYSPYDWWGRPSWIYRGSVLDGFVPAPAPLRSTGELPGTAGGPAGAVRRVVVTVGTSGYGFERLVHRLVEVLPKGCDVFWQTGATDVEGLGIDARPYVAAHELAAAMARADVVISHAGVGSALGAMHAGRAPVLVPRRAAHGEHVDDHQEEIAAELARRGVAVRCAVEDLDRSVLDAALGLGVRAARDAPAFRLERRRSPARQPLGVRRATA